MSLKVAFVNCLPALTDTPLSVPRYGEIAVDRPDADTFARYLHELGSGSELATVFVGSESSVPEAVRTLRRNRDFGRTRVYVLSNNTGGPVPGWTETYDVEDIVKPSAFDGFGLIDRIEIGVRAFKSLVHDGLYTDYYLDMTFNKIFDWFETTRWDWKEIDFDRVQPDLLGKAEIDHLAEAAIAEFGTLPGAHNFLREWDGETSFSSWALMWGAEEARHSLVQARYLDKIGVKVRSKHALYKREPYPIGDSQIGTLVMNIISEARASQTYRHLAADTKEPVIRQIWKLLSHDEARHCRAFTVFSEELCDDNLENQIAALKMSYIWLADRGEGVKHPAGFFYPHSTSTDGLRRLGEVEADAIDDADKRVLQIIRRLAKDDSIENVKDIKRKLRSLI